MAADKPSMCKVSQGALVFQEKNQALKLRRKDKKQGWQRAFLSML
jgi:hypothetical protein